MTGRPQRRYVVHLPLAATDLAAAQQYARVMVRSLAFLAGLDGGETTVSEEDGAEVVRHRVFCDRTLDGGRRCALRAQHADACVPRTRRRP